MKCIIIYAYEIVQRCAETTRTAFDASFQCPKFDVHNSEPGGGTGAGVARRGGRVLEPLLGAVVGTRGCMADNVLWIITDDQMRSTLRTMDKTWKRLVEKGVRFRRGYTAMPWCGPARASLLTSRYPHDHGCHNNQTHQPFIAQGHDRDTVATRIRAPATTRATSAST